MVGQWTLLSLALLLKARSAVDSEVEVRNVEDSKEAFTIDYSARNGNMCTILP